MRVIAIAAKRNSISAGNEQHGLDLPAKLFLPICDTLSHKEGGYFRIILL